MSQTSIDTPRICSACGLKFLSPSPFPLCLVCRDQRMQLLPGPPPSTPTLTVEDCIRVQKMGPEDVLLIRLPKQVRPHQVSALVQQCKRCNIRCVVLDHDVEAQMFRPVNDSSTST